MNPRVVAAELDRMAAEPGIMGCALVDPATGLVWQASGSVPDAERTWEAAVDYWRLHDRQRAHFSGLGELAAAVMYHRGGVLAMFPCCTDPDLLLVSVGQHRGVDWTDWQRKTRALGQRLQLPT
jgi:hypothetical protein